MRSMGIRAVERIMRAIIFLCVVLLGMGSLSYAQDQTLRGVYAPPGLTPPAKSLGKSTLSFPDSGEVGVGPRVTISQEPSRGLLLPSNVNAAPIPDRPGYGKAVVNGRRVIIDLNSNRIYQVLD
jgi:hypothetical protein